MGARGLAARISPRRGLECTDVRGSEQRSLQRTGTRELASQPATRVCLERVQGNCG